MGTLKMGSRPENIELALGCKPVKEVANYNGNEKPDHGGVKSGIVDVKPKIVDVNPENVGVNSENVGVNSENVGVNTAIHYSRKDTLSGE